jgi:hypothetical protein
MWLNAAIGDNRKNAQRHAEPPKEGADRSTRAAAELAGAPAIVSGAPPDDSRVSNFGDLLSLDPRWRRKSGWEAGAQIGALVSCRAFPPRSKEALMSIAVDADNLESAVRNALLTTRATAHCPFHPEVIIRVGDDAAETHAFYRARNLVRSDGTGWDHELLVQEIARQLADAADSVCPHCSDESQA